MKKFIIAWSNSFLNEINVLKSNLEQKWYEVINYTKELWDRAYQEVYDNFFEDIKNADNFILLNLDKKGIEWYIGYESFAELSYAIMNYKWEKDKKIYLYKMPSKEVGCYDEIMNFLKRWYIEIYNE